jgi:hypothetical protein
MGDQMEISVIDGSNYFKGLLLLIRKDRRITETEIQLMERVGASLGFERRFCRKAITEILVNTYIEDAPPVFSTADLARMFIKDGLIVAHADKELHPFELDWLKSVAKVNRLDPRWLRKEADLARATPNHRSSMAVDHLRIKTC